MSRKPLSFSAGRRGNRARVFENIRGGPVWLTTTANPKPQLLGRIDWATAKERAWQEVEKGKVHRKNAVLGNLTLGTALTAYRVAKDNAMCPSQEYFNQRCTVLWFAILGRERVVSEITKGEIADFQRKSLEFLSSHCRTDLSGGGSQQRRGRVDLDGLRLTAHL